MPFSIIIPLYNRPEEMDELLASLCAQTDKQFEVIIVEDGSSRKSDAIVDKYRDRLSLTYFEKPNSGPGPTRNAGAARARYDYLIFFDSDCIIPPHYIETVSRFLRDNYVDAYGGPDAALPSFTTVQKAINYSMTSFLRPAASGETTIDGQILSPQLQHGGIHESIPCNRRIWRHAFWRGHRF